jgi:hypothetical protein
MANLLTSCVNRGGLHAFIEIGADNEHFYFGMVYHPIGIVTSSRVSSFVVSPSTVSCSPSISEGFIITPSTTRLLCTRDAKVAVNLLLNADSDLRPDTPLSLPSVKPPPLWTVADLPGQWCGYRPGPNDFISLNWAEDLSNGPEGFVHRWDNTAYVKGRTYFTNDTHSEFDFQATDSSDPTSIGLWKYKIVDKDHITVQNATGSSVAILARGQCK